ncbi:S-layer homology domain-containing protein [Brevibacillus parabrevis]|uniref:S-layer homology domain-containing protein n=1 Tax=Brevibacillus parabrevis TaxID=54914 RepID=UPI0023803140|nr:S-layer homology domain-containing protein [Brevibacillus parabrevis]WDV94877.1 S-layer homology domain-containing protein [Brevibacillus parabrevis]
MNKNMFSILIVLVFLSVQLNTANALDSFSDTKGHWGEATIGWAAEKHIVNGYPDGMFKPNNRVNEAEFVTMLINFYGKSPGTKNWPYPYYDLASAAKWPVYAKDPDRKTEVTRKHVAELIAAGDGTSYRGDEAIMYLLIYKLAKGKGSDVSVAGFDGKSPMTRAEAAQFLKNLYDAGRTEMKPVVQSPPLPDTLTPLPPGVDPSKLPKDPASQPALESLVDSLKMNGNTLTGKIPDIPKGYKLSVSYLSNKPFSKPINLKDKKPGETFTLTVGSEGGDLQIGFDVGNEVKSNALVQLPSLEVEWGNK